jgi:hypothetical protein
VRDLANPLGGTLENLYERPNHGSLRSLLLNILRTAHLRHLLGAAVALVSMIALLQVNGASGAYADMLSTSTPTLAPPNKNSTQSGLDTGDGSFAITLSEPSSKNNNIKPLIDNSTGETFAALPNPGSKNYDGLIQSSSLSDNFAALLDAGGSLITCGASANTNWTTTSSSNQVILQCELTVPQAGWVFLSTNGSVARQDGEYEAQFNIDIDTTGGDSAIDRFVNIYNDGGDGTDKSVALSVLKPVTAGTHTFYLLGKRYSGTGTVLLIDPTLTVIFIPATDSQILTCGASGNLDWTTTSSSFQVIRQCELTVPQTGWVFLSADGSVTRLDGEYEAWFEIGIDGTSGSSATDRWVNVYNDSGDGTDKSVALSVLKPVTAGTHTFNFLGTRYSGTGTVQLFDPTLTAIFIPTANSQAVTCGASGDMNWTTTSTSFQIIRQCTLMVPQAGWVFLSADGSVAREDGEYEAWFDLSIDGTSGNSGINRWVNVYNDSGDGTDETVALSRLQSVTAGTHTFYFLGNRYSGAGTVRLIDPTLTVIVPGAQLIYLPLIMK